MDKDSLEDLSLKEDKKIIIRRNLEMEMCYDGALVMPRSYAVMNEDEMTYVEGGTNGNGWWNSVGFIGACLDVIILALPLTCWMSNLTKAGKALRTVVSMAGYTKNAFVSLVSGWMVQVGLVASKSVANSLVGVMWNVAGLSLGGLIAKGMDMVDGQNNNYCFG